MEKAQEKQEVQIGNNKSNEKHREKSKCRQIKFQEVKRSRWEAKVSVWAQIESDAAIFKYG